MTPDSMTPDKLRARAFAGRPFLISFSGIDGAGKTTQIEQLTLRLQHQGLRVRRLTFWDDVAVWSKMRAGVGERTVEFGDPDRAASFSPKNNKHIRKWYLTAARAGFYVLDVIRLQRLLASSLAKGADVVIFDRYIYDQIANIYSRSLVARVYSKLLLSLTPAPDLAFVIDASPDAAFARKPEYPLEFVQENRRNFLHLRELVPQLIVVSDAAPEAVGSEIYFHVNQSRLVEQTALEGKTEVIREERRSPAAEFL